MKKIVYILDTFPELSETFVLNEILELERQGKELIIISIGRPKGKIIHPDFFHLSSSVIYLPTSFFRLMVISFAQVAWLIRSPKKYVSFVIKAKTKVRDLSLLRLVKFIFLSSYIAQKIKYNEIKHIHTHFAGRSTFVCMFVSWLLDIPFSFTAHAADIFINPKSLELKIKEAKFVATISNFNKNYLIENFMLEQSEADKIYIIRCGINFEKFKSHERMSTDPPLILCVARLIEKKGHEYLIRALDQLKKEGIKFKCVIVGEGPLGTALRDMVEKLHFKDEIIFTGALSQDQVLELYQQAFVFVLPCVEGKDKNKDGIPVALMEAMAMGLPVISTTLTGNPELIDDGRNGLLVQPNDGTVLAQAIKRVLFDKDFYRYLSSQAPLKIQAQFELRDNVDKIKQLFNR